VAGTGHAHGCHPGVVEIDDRYLSDPGEGAGGRGLDGVLPVCVIVASVAMFSGISGAALLTPVFLIGFPLLSVPRLSTVTAVGASLLLETSGFGAGVARYTSMRLVDGRTAGSIVLVSLPTGAAGAIVARHAPVAALRIGYGLLMIALAVLLAHKTPGRLADQSDASPALVSGSDRAHPNGASLRDHHGMILACGGTDAGGEGGAGAAAGPDLHRGTG
jgi:uncharacterized membrane protein YfcA